MINTSITFQSENQEIAPIRNQRLLKLKCISRVTYQLANEDIAMRLSLKAALAESCQTMVKTHCQTNKT